MPTKLARVCGTSFGWQLSMGARRARSPVIGDDMYTRTLPRSALVLDSESSAKDLIVVPLEEHGFSVYESGDPSVARHRMQCDGPDLIVVNWAIAQSNPLGFVQEVRSMFGEQETSIIGIGGFADEGATIAALDAGADDFLSKPFSQAIFMARVRAVLRRRAPELSDREITFDGLTLSPARHEVMCLIHGRRIRVHLGPTEFRLLHFMLCKPEVPLTRAEIRKKVWGENQEVDERTIDAHIKRLRSSLATTGMDEMVQTVRTVGYQLCRKASFDTRVPAAA